MRRPSLVAVLALASLAAVPHAVAGEMHAKPAKKADKAATEKEPKPPGASPETRARIAAFALRQTEFGSISLLPVRFEKSRIAGPFEDGGRTLYCVSSRMKGRALAGYERAKVILRDAGGVLSRLDEDDEVCEGHRTEPFPELEEAARRE